jgi:glycosyltransferase involved in cell wall biosynthesis
MSRELIGFAIIALACIIISPFYKTPSLRIEQPRAVIIEETSVSVRSKNTKSIVLLSDSFLPTTFAGSELSAFETIRYLRERGHQISIYVKEWEVSSYDGFPIHKYDMNDQYCKQAIINCDLVFFQMGDDPKNLEIVKHRTKPVYVFIHLVDRYPWLLQQRMSFPISVVYNSHMTQDTLPTLHDNMRMIPFVETDKFKYIRNKTIQNDVVCLINCNHNKGGELFKELAYRMPDVQFMGVKGGYSNQVIDKKPPPNLTYIENQKDIMVVFKRIGILVMPSKNETWGRTAVEAMASGVPVIHSESAGLVECVGGAGIMCAHDDKDAWEDAIRRLISDRAYRERVRQNGFRRVEEIQVEQIRGRQELAIKVESN